MGDLSLNERLQLIYNIVYIYEVFVHRDSKGFNTYHISQIVHLNHLGNRRHHRKDNCLEYIAFPRPSHIHYQRKNRQTQMIHIDYQRGLKKTMNQDEINQVFMCYLQKSKSYLRLQCHLCGFHDLLQMDTLHHHQILNNNRNQIIKQLSCSAHLNNQYESRIFATNFCLFTI